MGRVPESRARFVAGLEAQTGRIGLGRLGIGPDEKPQVGDSTLGVAQPGAQVRRLEKIRRRVGTAARGRGLEIGGEGGVLPARRAHEAKEAPQIRPRPLLDEKIERERLPREIMLPAPGQGALAIMARIGDAGTVAVARAAVHDEAASLCVAAERALLRRLEGGCQVPVGAYANFIRETVTPTLQLTGRVVSLDGRESVEQSVTAPVADSASAVALGVALAEELLAGGADRILR